MAELEMLKQNVKSCKVLRMPCPSELFLSSASTDTNPSCAAAAAKLQA
jgi:hypothetical protein